MAEVTLKKFLETTVTLLFVLAQFSGCFKKTPPNVLLITIDTLRADHLGCYGYSRKLTPNLDNLASRGILFENAFAVMPTTVPSHGSMLFGTWPRIHGSTSNFYRYSNKKAAFLPQVLRQAGYSTAAFLSIDHLSRAIQAVPGFETLYGAKPEEIKTAEKTTGQALEWFRTARPSRYFVWVHLWEPHQPYDLHPEFMEKIQPDFINDVRQAYSFQAKGAYTKDGLRKMVQLYDNEIAYVDHRLGLFLRRMEDQSLLDNTTIIVTSDHGESLDEILDREGYGFDHGEFLYDAQLRVPLLIVPPKSEEPGRRVSQTVTLLDIMPTVLEMSGLPIPEMVHGVSLIPFLGKRQSLPQNQLVFLHRGKYRDRPTHPELMEEQFGVRDAKYKLIFTAESHQWFLYQNLDEGTPIVDARVQEGMQRRLQSWLQLTDRFKSRKPIAVSPEETERLKALGYVQ